MSKHMGHHSFYVHANKPYYKNYLRMVPVTPWKSAVYANGLVNLILVLLRLFYTFTHNHCKANIGPYLCHSARFIMIVLS